MKVAVMEPVLQTFGDFFVEARRHGFAGVELTLTREQLRADDRRHVENLRRSADASSLSIHSLVLGEHNHGGVASADAHIALAAAEDVEIAIEWAVTLGADAVLVPFFLEAELRSEADVDRCADAFGALCPLAASRGVTLCFEGLLAADRIRALAERVDSPGFGCYFDLANPVRRGLDPASEIRLLGSLIRRVHVKDVLVRAGDVHPGLGRVDFRECARALDEIGYDGWLTLETPPAPPPLVARDLSFVRSRFPHVGANARWPQFGAFSYDFGRGRWLELATTFARLDLVDVVLGRELLDECLEQPDVLERAHAALREHGLAVAALAGYRNLVAPDPSSRRANIEYIRRCLELAPALGTYVVCTETGTRHPGSDWTDSPDNVAAEAWRLLDEALETLVPAAESSGTILALEAHVKNVLKTQDQLLALLERFPSQHLQVVCDPYNYISAGLVADRQRATTELLDRFEHRFVVAHLKDVAAGGAETGTPELGTGVFEQRPYLEFLRVRRPDLSLVLEHLPLENIPIARARVLELAGL
jgi:sugar phosphate isomerase/epimerase